jgi:hypothetical protein
MKPMLEIGSQKSSFRSPPLDFFDISFLCGVEIDDWTGKSARSSFPGRGANGKASDGIRNLIPSWAKHNERFMASIN